MDIVQHLFSGAYESVPSLLVWKHFLLWLPCILIRKTNGKIILDAFLLVLMLMCKVNIWKKKKESLLWPCEVLISWSEFACLIYICQQEGYFERRRSDPASLRKIYNLHGYVLCIWDMPSQRLEGEVCFGDYLLCECWGRQQKMCVSFSHCWFLVYGTVSPEEGKVKERESHK